MYNYSQCYQDLFALSVNKKERGTYLDIGCNVPDTINNTKLLREFGWHGLSLDLEDYSKEWYGIRNNTFKQCDATNKEELDKVLEGIPVHIDYLSFDIDESTVKGIKNMDFDKFKFKCITIEHDAYKKGNERRRISREILESYGYHRIVSDMAGYEDWYHHPDLVINDNYLSPLLKLGTIKNIRGIKDTKKFLFYNMFKGIIGDF